VSRRSGLGRGLDALLPVGETPGEPVHRGGPAELDIAAISPNPRQPRKDFDDASLEELAGSIRSLGILQPLLVRVRREGGYELVAGERRLRAARRAGLTRVPVVVVDTDEPGALERAIVENLHRENLNPIEEAAALKQLMEDAGLTQEALGRRLGRSRVAITNAVRLLELPLSVQRWLVEGKLSAAHGKALLGLTGAFQERLARRAAQEGLTVRETEDLVRRYAAMSEPGAPGPRQRPAAVSAAQQRLADRLQARVRVDLGKRKGRIVVDFSSLEELERLVRVMLGDAPGAEPAVIRLD
jgi:ParB family chromosome partitioning protein